MSGSTHPPDNGREGAGGSFPAAVMVTIRSRLRQPGGLTGARRECERSGPADIELSDDVGWADEP